VVVLTSPPTETALLTFPLCADAEDDDDDEEEEEDTRPT